MTPEKSALECEILNAIHQRNSRVEILYSYLQNLIESGNPLEICSQGETCIEMLCDEIHKLKEIFSVGALKL